MRRYSFSIGFWAACLGWLLDGFDFTIFLLVMPAIAKEFGVSVTTTSVSITLTLLVRLLGGLFAGMAADRWGRKLPLMISIVWFALCDGAVAFAPSFQAVLILRTLFGFGMGAEWASGSTLAMESIPERSRGLGSGILQGSWAVGYLIAGVVYTWVSWRTLFLLAALPALLVIPIRFWVKESPRARQARFVPLMHALQDGLWKRVLSASLLLGAAVAAYYAMTALSPTMLQTELGLTKQQTAPRIVLFNLGMLAGALGAGWLASKKGPALAIALPSLLALPVLPLYVKGAAAGAFVGGLFGVGSSGVTPALLTQLFPAEVRARCVGLVYHLGAVTAAFIPTLVAVLHDRVGWSYAWAIGVVAAVAELLVVFWVRIVVTSPAAALSRPVLTRAP